MAKRFTETDIWKKQRWFKKLHPIYKLVWAYVKDECDHAGIWKIECTDLIDDLGIEDSFSLNDFISQCNIEYDKMNGGKVHRERVKVINENLLWLTGFIQFQYENKEKIIQIHAGPVRSALQRLNGLGIYAEALRKGYIRLSERPQNGYFTIAH